MSQTWHQLRPGEARYDCGGCHGHAEEPLDFFLTAASKEDYQIPDLTTLTPIITKDETGEASLRTEPLRAVDVEFHRDIKPILDRSCVSCHSKDNPEPAAQLVLDDDEITNGYNGTFRRLADDSRAEHGIKPIIRNGTWRQTNASRYVRKFQARRSLLIWKIFGRRLDGWTNEDFPTESVPGDASTLPEGASANEADIDFTGTIMPPPDADPTLHPPLTEDEKIMFARWVDLGCPTDSQREGVAQDLGWFADELRPTLSVSLPKIGRDLEPLTQIRLGMFDYYSGLDRSSLSVRGNFELDGHAAGTELAALFTETGNHVWSYSLASPIDSLNQAILTVTIKDSSGNLTEVKREFSIGPAQKLPTLTAQRGTFSGEVKLIISGEPQAGHQIEYTEDFQNWFPFMNLMDFDGMQEVIDEQSPDISTRFYRTIPTDPSN